MAREIKVGNDKRPAPLINQNVPLYNLTTGQVLTDEGGTPIVSAEDTFLTSESSSAKATSIVYTDEPKVIKQKNVKLSGKNFNATGNTITAEPGTGLFTQELSIGDKLLLPTGFNGSTRVYETRTVTSVDNNDTCQIATSVTQNLELFGELIKVISFTVNPNLKIEEQFPTFTEVSTTILGYPKAEEQLGLFSNVSTYGLDEDEFIFYRRDSGESNGGALWENRKNKIYGDHYRSRAREVKEEAAIALESYRVPYAYPYGPRDGAFSSEAYVKFNTFLKIGALLYDEYKDSNPEYALNFLPYVPNHVELFDVEDGPNVQTDELGNTILSFEDGETITRTDTNQVIGTVKLYRMVDRVMHFNEDIGYVFTNSQPTVEFIPIVGSQSGTTAEIRYDLTYGSDDLYFSNLITPLNPYYNSNEELFAQIDTWTEVYRKMIKGEFLRPNLSPLDADYVQNLNKILTYIQQPLGLVGTILSDELSRPGYSTGLQTRGYLESRKAFRYQPGRISGYTFGVRASNDARDDNNVIIEWGIGNNTDDLVFQIRGSNFSIVRRSIVPLENDVLEENKLNPEDQVLITKDTQNNSFSGLDNKQVYETVISRDKWNGDQLNGNGPSGYLWSAENVTMYKIEFGWYGAIGVQFYAYVPVNNGEARWVKLHRLIIENKLGKPCMGDPYYKFRYSLITLDHINVTTPQYIYKYGTSCYIDGGDEGTLKVGSATSALKTAPLESGGAELSTTVVAIQPKTTLSNSLGEIIKNKKQIFPRKLSVSSSGLTEITVVKCKACPGFSHTYQPNLNSGYSGDERTFVFPAIAGGYDRSRVILKELTKEVTTSSGNTITLSDVDFIRIGDIVDLNNSISEIPSETIITDIDTNTNVVTLSNSLTSVYTGNVQIQPVFLDQDLKAKLIASRIYNTYILEYDDTSLLSIGGQNLYTAANLGTIDSEAVVGTQQFKLEDYLISRTIPNFFREGFGFSLYPSEFNGRLSRYNALAASPIPVVGTKNTLLFLSSEKLDGGSYSSGQFADYKIGITSLRPEFDGVDTINWYDSQGNLKEFTDDYKLFAERFSEGIRRDLDGYERGEFGSLDGRQRAFTIDYRIPQPDGPNTGSCAYVNITTEQAQFIQCQQVYGTELPLADVQASNPTFDPNAYYIRSTSFPFNFNPQNAEVGFNQSDPQNATNPPVNGSGIRFDSDIITYSDSSSDPQNPVTYKLIKLTDHLPGQPQFNITTLIIWYIPISLESFRKLATKAFDYNPFPLYFFVEMKDGARANGLEIKEEGENVNSYNPNWFVSNSMTVTNEDIEIGPIGDTTVTTGSLNEAPPNFVDSDRLSSALIDIQNQAQLRPYEIIDKIYVGQGTKTIDYDKIFNFDKETITPDLLNTTAYFFLATSKETDPTNDRSIQGTLTYVEQ